MNAELISQPASLVLAMTNDHADAVTQSLPRSRAAHLRAGAAGTPRRAASVRAASWTFERVAGRGRRSCATRHGGGRSRAMRSAIRWASRSRPTRRWPTQLDDLTARLARLIADRIRDSGTGLRSSRAGISQDGGKLEPRCKRLSTCIAGSARGRATVTEQDVIDFQFVGQDVPWLLNHWATEKPDHPFLIWEPKDGASRTWTYSEFAADVSKLAAGLHQRGITKGDKVLIHCRQLPGDGARLVRLRDRRRRRRHHQHQQRRPPR